MVQEAETSTESQAGLAVARSDAVALFASRWRQSGAGFPSLSLNGEEGGDSQLIGSTLVSFREGARS